MSKAIRIYNSSEVDSRYFEGIVKTLEQVFNVPAAASHISLKLDDNYDHGREQYNSTGILAKILRTFDTTDKTIVVVDVDLYIPVLTFVYGEAQLDGSAAVVSTHRLKNQYYGLPEKETLLIERLEKEIVHELGHTFGMFHCRDYECVMKASTYVEEIDLKKKHPCAQCYKFLASRQSENIFSSPGT